MPASADGALTVGAIDERDGKASYSNYGSDLEIYAPGSKYVRVWICIMCVLGASMTISFLTIVVGRTDAMHTSQPTIDSIYSASNTGDAQYRTMSGTDGHNHRRAFTPTPDNPNDSTLTTYYQYAHTSPQAPPWPRPRSPAASPA